MGSKHPMLVVSAICTAAIIYYSSLPAGASGPGGINPSGGLVHFIVYAVYAAVVLATASKFSLPKPVAVSFVIAAALGAITEATQLFVPGRFCDPADWAIDAMGAAFGLLMFYLLERKIKNRR